MLGIVTHHLHVCAVGHVVRSSWNPVKRLLWGFSWRNALIFEAFVKKELSFFFSSSYMNEGSSLGFPNFYSWLSSMMTIITANCYINNAVRAEFIFPDTVTAHLQMFLPPILLEKKQNVPSVVWLFPISCHALISGLCLTTY